MVVRCGCRGYRLADMLPATFRRCGPQHEPPRTPGAPRPLAPLGFAGPSRSIAAELLWRYAGPVGPQILFFLSHFDDTVLTGVAIRGQNGLLRYRAIAISPLMKALAAARAPPPVLSLVAIRRYVAIFIGEARARAADARAADHR
jgi:hypothetical protein